MKHRNSLIHTILLDGCLVLAALFVLSGCAEVLPIVPVVPVEPVEFNGAPVIRPPLVWPQGAYLIPRERYLFDCNLRDTAHAPVTGIYDPEGDAWHIVSVTVWCSERRYAEVVYRPPYEPGVFHAEWGGQVIENAFLVFPLAAYEAAGNGLPYAPLPLAGYPFDPYTQRNTLHGIIFPRTQVMWVRITAADEHGAAATETFMYELLPLEFNAERWTERERRSRLIENNRDAEENCYREA